MKRSPSRPSPRSSAGSRASTRFLGLLLNEFLESHRVQFADALAAFPLRFDHGLQQLVYLLRLARRVGPGHTVSICRGSRPGPGNGEAPAPFLQPPHFLTPEVVVNSVLLENGVETKALSEVQALSVPILLEHPLDAPVGLGGRALRPSIEKHFVVDFEAANVIVQSRQLFIKCHNNLRPWPSEDIIRVPLRPVNRKVDAPGRVC